MRHAFKANQGHKPCAERIKTVL